MRFSSDRQRRAIMAKLNKFSALRHFGPEHAGLNLGPYAIEVHPSSYQDIGVISSNTSGADYLLQFASPSHPNNTDIEVGDDKSDVIKQTDDMIAKYGASLPQKKPVVGAVSIDDYGGLKIKVRNKVKPELDEIFNTMSKGSDKISMKKVGDDLVVDFKGDVVKFPFTENEHMLQEKLGKRVLEKLKEGYRLNEFDLSIHQKYLLGDIVEDEI